MKTELISVNDDWRELKIDGEQQVADAPRIEIIFRWNS
jgi:hypothetical protein